jgi:hypothetical protein
MEPGLITNGIGTLIFLSPIWDFHLKFTFKQTDSHTLKFEPAF